MRFGRACLIVLGLLLAAAPARADDQPLRHGFSTAGDPLLNAWPSDSLGTAREWRSCPPDGSPCQPLTASAYDGGRRSRDLHTGTGFLPVAPGETPAGTTSRSTTCAAGSSPPCARRSGPAVWPSRR